jgi:hypothetical protein
MTDAQMNKKVYLQAKRYYAKVCICGNFCEKDGSVAILIPIPGGLMGFKLCDIPSTVSRDACA